jgi:predicted acyltransferase
VEWIGCALHDLIQPSFSFLVGVALPFSIANRLARGQAKSGMVRHAIYRALALILLGVFLRSSWTFEDTLSQIGLGYVFLFLLGFRPVRDQWLALGALLVGYWAAFALYPLPGPDFDYAKVGVASEGLLSGFAAHWNKNSNLAWAFDTWFLNLFPRKEPFQFNGGGYATLSFIPTLATMVLGLLAGGVLRNDWPARRKLQWLTLAGLICLGMGTLLGWLGVCPVVKRIWTPSWSLFSGGWCFLLLAGFYGVVDVLKFRRWAFPLVVIGMNSILAYCSEHLFMGVINESLGNHFKAEVFQVLGTEYAPLVRGGCLLLILWLLLYWMYRQKFFLRI